MKKLVVGINHKESPIEIRENSFGSIIKGRGILTMKESKGVLGLFRITLAVSIGMVLVCGSGTVVLADTQNVKLVKKLDGEQLYAINCSRCHTERYPTERTDAQWKTILMHMQVRANLPPEQARKILKYMKENN